MPPVVAPLQVMECFKNWQEELLAKAEGFAGRQCFGLTITNLDLTSEDVVLSSSICGLILRVTNLVSP